MANSLTAASPEYRSGRMQLLLQKKLVAREISNMEERATLTNGIKVHRPYHSDVKVNTYTKGTAVTPQDVTVTDEYLTIDQTKEATVYIDNIDKIQNKYDMANKLIDRIGYALKRNIDGAFLAEVENMTYTVDDGSFGGTSGNPFSASVSSVFKLFTTVEATMNTANVEDTKPRFAVITPNIKALLQQTNVANGFNQADAALNGSLKGMGYLGTRGNFNIFVSNDIYHKMVLTSDTTIMTAGDTVTIAGVKLTAAAKGSAATAGEFAIQDTAADCMTNIALAINGTATPSASTYIAVSDANRAIWANLGISAVATATTVTIVTQGYTTYAEVGTHTSFGTQEAHCWFGQYGVTDLVIQADVTVQANKEPLKTGYNYLCYDLFGIKTFNEGAKRGVKVNVVAG